MKHLLLCMIALPLLVGCAPDTGKYTEDTNTLGYDIYSGPSRGRICFPSGTKLPAIKTTESIGRTQQDGSINISRSFYIKHKDANEVLFNAKEKLENQKFGKVIITETYSITVDRMLSVAIKISTHNIIRKYDPIRLPLSAEQVAASDGEQQKLPTTPEL